MSIRIDDSIETNLLRGDEESDLKQRVWIELMTIMSVGFPSVVAMVSAFGSLVVTQLFIGHVSSIDLAGFALAQTFGYQVIKGVILGMSIATGTLCGQSFGANQHHIMGLHLQQSWIVNLISVTIFLPILIFGSQIFKLAGQAKSVANNGGYITLWFIPYMYSVVFSENIQMYLQAQSKNMIVSWLSPVQFITNILLALLFVYFLNWGFSGAMFALSISSWLLIFGEFIYIFGGWCPNSWKGFTIFAFKDLVPVVKFSISSGMMLCFELWSNIVLVLLAGYMPNPKVALSAFSICHNIYVWELMISLGLLGAACARVANELGRGNTKAVKFSIKVLLGIPAMIGGFFSILCMVFRKKLAYLFTNDESVVEAVSDLSLLLSFSIFLSNFSPILKGVAAGAGMQGPAALATLVCYYLIGIPLGVSLGFLTSLEVKGLWIGLMGAIVSQTIALLYIIWTTNWDNQVKKVMERSLNFT